LIHYHASWVLPIITQPVRDAWIAVDAGRVVACGTRDALGSSAGCREVDLGQVALLPGLVNSHTHLELSYLSDEIPPATQFVAWIRSIVAARRRRSDPREILDAVDRALAQSVRSGTAVVGDITNTLMTYDALARSPLAGVVFYELIQFNGCDADGFVEGACQQIAALTPTDKVRVRLAAHAPYSVGPLVFQAIRRVVSRERLSPCSVHLSESAEEVEFVHSGSGPIREALEELGAWDPGWVAPAVSPVQFLDESGFLDSDVLAVHGTQMTAADLRRLAARGTRLITCPRSNGRTGAGAPPIAEFYQSGVPVAVGTDSLASAPDLNVFAEMATMRVLAPDVPASKLLESATLEGARALGFDADYGTIEPGKLARLVVVDMPAHVDDVEEYLVSGIHPEQIRWMDSCH
jgi:cytosine/adenosine deaminase-related metal-dependent hydrolase